MAKGEGNPYRDPKTGQYISKGGHSAPTKKKEKSWQDKDAEEKERQIASRQKSAKKAASAEKSSNKRLPLSQLVAESEVKYARFKEIAYEVYDLHVGKEGFPGSGSALNGRVQYAGGPYKAYVRDYGMPDFKYIGIYASDSEAKKAVKNELRKMLKNG